MVARRTDTYIYPIVKKFITAWNKHDLESLAEFYSDKIVREGRSETLTGKDALRGSWERILRAFPDLSADYKHQFSVGTHGVLEWVMRGTHKGVYTTDLGDIQPTGNQDLNGPAFPYERWTTRVLSSASMSTRTKPAFWSSWAS
jgi:predicted ester cyclase